MEATGYLLALEGGGTRSQAALLDGNGIVLGTSSSTDVNTNFVPFEQAQAAARAAVASLLSATGIAGEKVWYLALALVGSRFGEETFGQLCPQADYRYYTEREVIFARADLYHPHGVAVAAATGATAFGIRGDDGRQVTIGGWGALLGDEGSAYAMGLLGLRAATRASEGRLDHPTRLVEAVCEHFGLRQETFRADLVRLAYGKPLNRVEIAGFARAITRLAGEGDPEAGRIVSKVAEDLASLALHAAQRLFTPAEAFDVAVAGGLLNAGEAVIAPLLEGLQREFPNAVLHLGGEQPAVALGRLAYHDLTHR